MKIRLYILSIFILLTEAVLPQLKGDFETSFNTIFDKRVKINGYYFGNNPAYLNKEVSTELLSLKALYNNSEGDYKRFLDPGNTRIYSLIASGKKYIDSSQIFKGDFSFQRKENNNWQWIFSRDNSGDNTFLIGDSTTGNTRYNGIIMNAEYAAALFNDLSFGLSLLYDVDEGLKQVSPRPTSKNREIKFTTGAAYSFTDHLTAGIKATVYDDVERIIYREDEGAINTETIILKFRGFDFPNIFRKKSETRYTYNNGYSAGLNAGYDNRSDFRVAAYSETGFNKYITKDDDTNPISEGFTKNNFLSGGLISNYSISNNAVIGFSYSFNLIENWSKYPNFNVVYGKNSYKYHSFSLGIEYLFTEKLSLGLEPGIGFSNEEMNDYYSNIYFTKNSLKYSVNFGITYNWDENLSSFFSARLGTEKLNEGNIRSGLNQSQYYSKFRVQDLNYRLAEEKKYQFNFVTAYIPGFGGEILLNLNYSLMNSGVNPFMSNLSRNNLSVYLEYRVQAY